MTVLVVHNSYQQPGGEDQVVAAETSVLESQGHSVIRYTASNHSVTGRNPIALAGSTTWDHKSYRAIYALLKRERPEVVHIHNTFPVISPAIYYAANRCGIPVVQSLHNYRLLCPSATLFRNGHVCQDCVGKFVPLPALRHACYRGSSLATGATATMLVIHRCAGTWQRMVDVYIALSEFARHQFVEGGLPASRLRVKPNFVYPDPGCGGQRSNFGLFAGRLVAEKGVSTLLQAWTLLSGTVPLEIIGDGPLAGDVNKSSIAGVRWRGSRSRTEVLDRMRNASFLVLPSIWYEAFPMTIVESYAVGLPVIASNLGSMAELVEHGRTGLHFRAGDSADLARTVAWAHQHPEQMAIMGMHARERYEQQYTGRRNHDLLMSIYKQAVERRQQPAASDIEIRGTC